MPLGLPVIAADWGGTSDYVRPETGILVGVESREQLASDLTEAMQRLAEDAELRERLGQQGRRHAEAELDWNRRINELMALYREIVPDLAVRDSALASRGPVLSLPRPAQSSDQDADMASCGARAQKRCAVCSPSFFIHCPLLRHSRRMCDRMCC